MVRTTVRGDICSHMLLLTSEYVLFVLKQNNNNEFVRCNTRVNLRWKQLLDGQQ